MLFIINDGLLKERILVIISIPTFHWVRQVIRCQKCSMSGLLKDSFNTHIKHSKQTNFKKAKRICYLHLKDSFERYLLGQEGENFVQSNLGSFMSRSSEILNRAQYPFFQREEKIHLMLQFKIHELKYNIS